jgi:hypothetical protein
MSRIPKLYTPEEFSILLRCSITTVYNSIRCGYIQATRLGMGSRSHLRIAETEIRRMQEFNAGKLMDKITDEKVKKLRRMRRIGE